MDLLLTFPSMSKITVYTYKPKYNRSGKPYGLLTTCKCSQFSSWQNELFLFFNTIPCGISTVSLFSSECCYAEQTDQFSSPEAENNIFQYTLSSFSSRLRSWSSSPWSVLPHPCASDCLPYPVPHVCPRHYPEVVFVNNPVSFSCCGAQGHWSLLFS